MISNNMILKGGKKIETKRNNSEKTNNLSEQKQIGKMLWKLETIEDFYPVYKTIIKKE